MQLIKAVASQGTWFPYEGDARFKIRRIPTALEKESYFRHFGKRAEVRRKGGAVISDTDLEAAQGHTGEMARYALLDTENVLVPADLLGGASAGEPDADGMVRLDGHWTDDVKRVVLDEVPSLAAWIVEQAASMVTKAKEEEAGLGKT